jgi:hypothetical protein
MRRGLIIRTTVAALIAIMVLLTPLLVGGCKSGASQGVHDQLVAANNEVAVVEVAALAFYADTDGTWPYDTNTIGFHTSLRDGPGGVAYITEDAVYDYHFDAHGKVVVPDATAWPKDARVKWDVASHEWTEE